MEEGHLRRHNTVRAHMEFHKPISITLCDVVLWDSTNTAGGQHFQLRLYFNSSLNMMPLAGTFWDYLSTVLKQSLYHRTTYVLMHNPNPCVFNRSEEVKIKGEKSSPNCKML